MNRAELIEIIKRRGSFPEGSGEGFEVMISQYPWFHSGYTLMLSTLYRKGDLSFDEMLKTYSISVADREVLYYLLNRDHGHHSDDVLVESEQQSPKEAGHKVEEDGHKSDKTAYDSDKEQAESVRKEALGEEGGITESNRSREQLQYEIEKRLAEIEEMHRREALLDIDEKHGSEDLTDIDEKHGSEDLADIDEKHSSDDPLAITGDPEPAPSFDSSLLDLDYSYSTYVLSESDKKKKTLVPSRKTR